MEESQSPRSISLHGTAWIVEIELKTSPTLRDPTSALTSTGLVQKGTFPRWKEEGFLGTLFLGVIWIFYLMLGYMSQMLRLSFTVVISTIPYS